MGDDDFVLGQTPMEPAHSGRGRKPFKVKSPGNYERLCALYEEHSCPLSKAPCCSAAYVQKVVEGDDTDDFRVLTKPISWVCRMAQRAGICSRTTARTWKPPHICKQKRRSHGREFPAPPLSLFVQGVASHTLTPGLG